MQEICHFCEEIEPKHIELEGGWVLHHWTRKDEKYLGRLILATKCHRRNWNDLSLHEATTLGIKYTEN